jgi:hypothetical protein
MFPARFFPARAFAARFWPKVGSGAAPARTYPTAVLVRPVAATASPRQSVIVTTRNA